MDKWESSRNVTQQCSPTQEIFNLRLSKQLTFYDRGFPFHWYGNYHGYQWQQPLVRFDRGESFLKSELGHGLRLYIDKFQSLNYSNLSVIYAFWIEKRTVREISSTVWTYQFVHME